jgi:hypothetical protein
MWTLPFVLLSFAAPVTGLIVMVVGLTLYVVALILQASDILYLSGLLMIAGCVESYAWYRRGACRPREWWDETCDKNIGLFAMGYAVPLYPTWNLVWMVMSDNAHGVVWLHTLAAPMFSAIEAMLIGSLLMALSGSWKFPEHREDRLQAVSWSVRAFGFVNIVGITTAGLLLPLRLGVAVNVNWIPMIAIVLALMFSYGYSISKTKNIDADAIAGWGPTERYAFEFFGALLLVGQIVALSGAARLSPELTSWLLAQSWYHEFYPGFLVGSGVISVLMGSVFYRVFIGKRKGTKSS